MSFKKHYIRTYEELYNYLNESLKNVRMRGKKPFRDLMRMKFVYAYRVLTEELNNIQNALLELRASHAFFKELFRLYTEEEVEQLLLLIRRRLRQARIIFEDIIREFDKLEKSDRSSAGIFRKGVGRLLSLYRRTNKSISLLKKYLLEISKMPDVRGEYVVVIAGLPQVGKSTLLSRLTSAKPVIGIYPFTTRELAAGHMSVEPYGKIVLVDSPGVLDTPIESKNIVEYKAIVAIKHLADHVLYVFAMYPGFYYSLSEQLSVYDQVKRLLGSRPITVLLNKVDLIDKDHVLLVTNEIEKSTGIRPIPISALTGFNLDKVREILIKHFMDKIQRP